MANSRSLLPLVFFLLSLLSSSTAEIVPKAVRILSDSGYQYMSLALHYAADSLLNSSKITIFAPSDSAFAGQPSLDLLPIRLRLHLIHDYFPPHILKEMPATIRIPTLLDGQYLTVTTPRSKHGNNGAVSLSKVPVNEDPLYDDGFLIIYRIDKLFSLLSFIQPPQNPSKEDEEAPYGEASRVLRSKGWSAVAAFLEMELLKARVTVFAPADKVLESRITDPNQFSSIVFRHVVPCRLSTSELSRLGGSVLTTNLQGFKIFLSQNGGLPEVNDVSVIMPEVYKNDWLVVHGIAEVLELPQHGEYFFV